MKDSRIQELSEECLIDALERFSGRGGIDLEVLDIALRAYVETHMPVLDGGLYVFIIKVLVVAVFVAVALLVLIPL